MGFEIGQVVRHRTCGIGKVRRVETAGSQVRVTVFFRDRPDVCQPIRADLVPLEVLDGHSDPWLDNLDLSVADAGASSPYLTPKGAVEKFLQYYPGGFYDATYIGDARTGERTYKLVAHDLWNAALGRDEFAGLLRAGRHGEAAERAMRVEGKTNLLSRFEKAALGAALKDAEGAHDFAEGLFDLIYGADGFEQRFARFGGVLEGLPQPGSETLKWPIQTLFPFLVYPQEHVFLKPEVTQQAARRRAFSLNYQSRPNWLTYSCLLRFGELLMQELADLKPRDMIDIQSFIFVTGESDNYA